jgi:hypothetical protein
VTIPLSLMATMLVTTAAGARGDHGGGPGTGGAQHQVTGEGDPEDRGDRHDVAHGPNASRRAASSQAELL